MSHSPKPEREHPSTYFVQDRSNLEEMARLEIQDKMITAGMGEVLPELSEHSLLRRVLDDERSVSDLAAILLQSDIADSIHHLLWTVSRQIEVRIFMSDGPEGKRLEVVKRAT